MWAGGSREGGAPTHTAEACGCCPPSGAITRAQEAGKLVRPNCGGTQANRRLWVHVGSQDDLRGGLRGAARGTCEAIWRVLRATFKRRSSARIGLKLAEMLWPRKFGVHLEILDGSRSVTASTQHGSRMCWRGAPVDVLLQRISGAFWTVRASPDASRASCGLAMHSWGPGAVLRREKDVKGVHCHKSKRQTQSTRRQSLNPPPRRSTLEMYRTIQSIDYSKHPTPSHTHDATAQKGTTEELLNENRGHHHQGCQVAPPPAPERPPGWPPLAPAVPLYPQGPALVGGSAHALVWLLQCVSRVPPRGAPGECAIPDWRRTVERLVLLRLRLHRPFRAKGNGKALCAAKSLRPGLLFVQFGINRSIQCSAVLPARFFGYCRAIRVHCKNQ